MAAPVVCKAAPAARVIEKILIANRGEIAIRIIRSCHEMGIQTVAIYSSADAAAPYVRLAGESWCIGEPSAFLSFDPIVQIAIRSGAHAVHPGYGFLSENSEFARAVSAAGLVFIGPDTLALHLAGSKIEAKALVLRAGGGGRVPVVPGYNGESQDPAVLAAEAARCGFPVLFKASAGGGGKGMRVVRDAAAVADAVDSAKREALNSFGNDALLIEKYIENARHIEVQIFGDNHGNVVHMFERECSVQRRHQKIIEESPSVVLTPQMRELLGDAAVAVGHALNYSGAGTVEFILDGDTNKFYFLEVNARLQVEHPVTEAVLGGMDLVRLQIEVARGRTLPSLGVTQANLHTSGHSIECRLNAEDAARDFAPCTGTVALFRPPSTQPGVRVDSGIATGSEVTIFYDSLLAKLIVHAPTRHEAILKMLAALQNTVVLGVTTNAAFLAQILSHPKFIAGELSTHFLEHHLPPSTRVLAPPPRVAVEYAAAALLWRWHQARSSAVLWRNAPSGWSNVPAMPRQASFIVDGNDAATLLHYSCLSLPAAEARFAIKHEGTSIDVLFHSCHEDLLQCSIDGVRRAFHVASQAVNALLQANAAPVLFIHAAHLGTRMVRVVPRWHRVAADEAAGNGGGTYKAPMPSKVLKVAVEQGQTVAQNDLLFVLESMKMETKFYAAAPGVVESIEAAAGQLLQAEQVVLRIKTE